MYREGRRYAGNLVVVYFRPMDAPRRVGFTAGRRLGTAVARNRAKRRIRAAFRRLEGRLCAQGDVVVVARPQAVVAPFREILAELHALCLMGRLMREKES